MTHRIVVVDDHELVRIGLQTFLNEHGLILAGQAATGAEGLALIQSLCPDLALIDVRLPDMSGIELCKAVRETTPSTRVAILTSTVDKHVVHTCLQTGIQGYLSKNMPGEELLQSIRHLLDGQSVLDPAVTEHALQWIQAGSDSVPAKDVLGLRDIEILRLMAQGMTNHEIGRQMHLSENTVKAIVNEIYQRLGVRNRVEAVMEAHQRGLL
ncbi:response regulator [Alicyclobacillus macrosporangiidus]|jgi:DNA-binding NarL/FixJ family response regulator|uniref:Two-component system, NarL family, response regulator LiaR n=1 Tax=Alicyclobacillus macrosporangiidus TaxID=392015 RepID=A0A1I7JII3_9BACL|nr:response regulator transcription factor [Alicyclobacillus macrosporangiidus]SFU84960.1 two-component system, NarL family, response regulator LiaR [Alicyclobacillus macrosporangiidus]